MPSSDTNHIMPPEPTPAPPTRRWRKRYLLILPIAGIALSQWISASARNSGLARLKTSGYPTTVADLDRWYAAVAPADNLAGPLMRASGSLRFKADNKAPPIPFVANMRSDEIPDSPIPPETLTYWRTALTANAEAWPALAEARSRTQSRYPINLNLGFNTVLNHLAPIKQLAQACALRALVAAEEGKTDESTEALRDILLCRRSLLPEPILISSLVGYALDATAFNAMGLCFSRARFTEPQLASIGEDLRQIASSNHIHRALVGETLMGATAFKTPPHALGVFPPPTGTAANLGGNLMFAVLRITGVLPADEAFYLRSMETMLGACLTLDSTSLDQADQLQNDINAALAAPTGKLKIYSRMLLPALGKAIHKAAEDQARLRLAQTAVAIERYRRAHENQPPTDLAQLVPTYLPEVPSDPFDNKPLRYAVKGSGYLLHSIGPDRIDQNGEEAPKAKNGQSLTRKDLVIEVKR
jgi:type II secretory pathway pseudopilin PulG